METIPNTSGYMIAGFLVTFVTMGIYTVSIYIRNRNLKQDVEMLESLQAKKSDKPSKPKKKK